MVSDLVLDVADASHLGDGAASIPDTHWIHSMPGMYNAGLPSLNNCSLKIGQDGFIEGR